MTFIKALHSMSPREKGSALLVTLMVIVGLSMLGLGFVAMSETENAISINQRNYSQAQVVSEAAARIVVDWFNQPERMNGLGLMPSAADRTALMQERWIDTNGDGADENHGRWKATATFFCCDKPYRPAVPDRLYGTYWSPDVLIDDSTTEGRNFLVGFNQTFFPIEFVGPSSAPELRPGSYSAEVTEIRIYAPPVIGATNTPNDINGTVDAGKGFYDEQPAGGSKGTRYGLATVAITSQVRRRPGELLSVAGNRVLAERTTRVVISEWPFPGPQGPIQSNANIQTGGSVVVHWGKMTSQGDLTVKREFQGLPWLDAHQIIPWWYGGNDTSVEWDPGKIIDTGDVVRPTNAATAAAHHYYASAGGGVAIVGPEPVWPVSGNVTGAEGITWTRRNPARHTIVSTLGAADYPIAAWGEEIMSRAFEDPWVQVRSRQIITNAPNANPEPFKWDFTVNDSITAPSPKKSHWTQFQDHSVTAPSSYKEVIFPRIDYSFWKELAIAGQGTEGVFYFRWVSDDLFSKNGVVDTFKNWTNTASGAEPGFYFFDTKNAQDPQIPGGEAFLTPAVDVSSSGGGDWTASGFIYLNAESFGTQGVAGVDGWFNFPGEPYLDTGVLGADHTTGVPIGELPATAGNRLWDWDDVNENGKFDLFLAEQPMRRLDGITTVNAWRPVYWFEGCTILDNAHDNTVTCAGTNCCSEPHEPYLNIQFPTRTESGVLIGDACCTGGNLPNSLTMGWFPNNAVDKLPKKRLPTDAMPNCPGADFNLWDPRGTGPEFCTSNYFDRDGPFDLWEGAGAAGAPVLNGVMYVEGTMESQGNARYFGSLLINGDVDNTGTNEVWFDERLVKDEWPPSDWPFPRVFISAIRTDDL